VITQTRTIRCVPEPADVYTQLRSAILSLDPEKHGLSPQNGTPSVWGLLMDMGFAEAVVTLVLVGEDTTSLYFGNGGGILGAGTLPQVADASQACLAQALTDLPMFHSTQDFSLPEVEQVKFILLTFEGALVAEADWDSLASGSHVLSQLWACGQEVIRQLRLIKEKV
jgi:hypothetical protein